MQVLPNKMLIYNRFHHRFKINNISNHNYDDSLVKSWMFEVNGEKKRVSTVVTYRTYALQLCSERITIKESTLYTIFDTREIEIYQFINRTLESLPFIINVNSVVVTYLTLSIHNEDWLVVKTGSLCIIHICVDRNVLYSRALLP